MNASRHMVEDAPRTILDESYVQALDRKWSHLLEGIPVRNDHQRYVRGMVAMVYENQMRHLKGLSEDTRQINTGPFTKYIFPILARVFPNLISNEICSTQPMNSPVGAIFYRDIIYSSNKGPTVAGAVMPRDFDRDYTSEFVNGEMCATGDGAAYGGAGTALNVTLAWTPVRPLNAALGFSVVIKEINPITGAVVQTATDDGVGGFTGNVASGVINYSNGSVSNFKFTNAVANNNKIQAFYFYDGESNSKIPTMSLDIKKKLIEATPRRLKALWSSEAAEDLRAMHGVEAETELVAGAASEIGLEIDRDNIMKMFQASTGTSASFDRIPPAGIAELDHLRAMLTQIATVSNVIHKKTLRAPANWIVTSPEISALLAQLTTHGDFRSAYLADPSGPTNGPLDLPRPMTAHGQYGIYRVGTLQNKWTVYEDPFFQRDMMLIGLKGATYLDSGYAWAPYVPLEVTSTFLDPNDMSFRKAFRTRYGSAILRPEYYGQLRVLNV
jgi:hypothetical protein